MTIAQLLSIGYNELKQKNIETYMLDTQLLLQKVLNCSKLFILTNKDLEVEIDKQELFISYITMRSKKMPVKYILEECEFMGLNFAVRKGVLIPRPETEILVEEVIKQCELNNYKKICDVCCGSGAIGIALSNFLGNVEIYCSDLSEDAFKITQENAKRLSSDNILKVIKSNLLDFAIKESLYFDVIVSNPPYVKIMEIENLMEDVKNYEPFMALSGGEDGLIFYRKIIDQSKSVLKKGGLIAFEIGHDQGDDICNMLKENNFDNISVFKDLAGLDRVVTAKK